MKNNVKFNVFVLMVERILQLGGALFVSSLIARYLSVSEFGQWQFSLQILSYAGTIGLICGAEIILPKMAKGNINKVIVNAFVLRLLFGLIALIISISTLYFINIDYNVKIFSTILFVTLIINEPFAIFSCYLQSKTNNFPLSIVRIVSVSLRITIILFVCFLKLNMYILAIAWVIESIVTGFGYLLCFIRFKSQDIYFEIKLINFYFMKSLAVQGSFFLFGQFLLMTSLRLDRIFVAKYANGDFVGNYMAVTQLLDSLFQFAIIINTVFITSFIYNKAKVKSDDLNELLKLSLIYIGISIFGSIVLYFLSDYIILIIYGDKYEMAVELLKDISFIIPFYTLSILLSSLIFKYAKYFQYLIVNIISVVFVGCYVYLQVNVNNYTNLIFTPYVYTISSLIFSFIIIMRIKDEEK